MIIAVDFDGTISLGKWPDVGPVNVDVMEALLDRKEAGDKIVLWTCRGGKELEDAVAWCRKYGLEFDAVNETLPEVLEAWGYDDTRKVFADEYWDDKAVNVVGEEMEELLRLRVEVRRQNDVIVELMRKIELLEKIVLSNGESVE